VVGRAYVNYETEIARYDVDLFGGPIIQFVNFGQVQGLQSAVLHRT
jgi:hypothetical protein